MMLWDFHLPRRLRPALARAATVVCDGDIEGLGLVEHVVEGVELGLRAYPAGVRHGVVLGLSAFELGAALRHGRRFSRLGDDAARAWFASWWSSPVGALRQFAKALKSMIALAYYDAPPIRARLEFHPDRWIAEAARRRLERYGLEIERAEEAVRAPDPLVPAPRRRRHA